MKDNKTKEKNKIFIILKVVGLIYTILLVIFNIAIIRTNLFPSNYIIAIVILQILITVLISIGLIKKHKTLKLNIICSIIIIIFSVIYINGINYANATRRFITTIFPKENIEQNINDYLDNGTFNVYISGIDTFDEGDNTARSDANILITVNSKTHEILLTSIPRDYYVTLHSKGEKDKLTHSGMYGIDETITTVEDLLNVNIDYYIKVDFTTLIKVVDVIEGVEVYSDYDFTRNNYNFKKGYNYVDGKAALVFSRERYAFTTGDNQRIKNQQYVIEAIIKKVSSSTKILTKYIKILETLSGAFESNIEQETVSSLVKEQIKNMPTWNIEKYSLTGTDASKTTYSYPNQKLYVMIPNENSVEQAKENIKEIIEKSYSK